MLISLSYPCEKNEEAKRYVSRLVLSHYLGLRVELIPNRRSDWVLEVGTERVNFDSRFLERTLTSHFESDSLPVEVDWIQIDAKPSLKIPVPIWPNQVKQGHLSFDIDFFGAIFFFVTRWEEIGAQRKDELERFCAADSVLARLNLLETPVVDLLVEGLWILLQERFPGLQREEPKYAFRVSHDVDIPFAWAGRRVFDYCGSLGKALFSRNPIQNIFRVIKANYHPSFDPMNNFEWILDEVERRGLKSEFFFITRTNHAFDGRHNFRSKAFEGLITLILNRGHSIGVHGSFLSFDKPVELAKELDELRPFLPYNCKEVGIRQHFLRFRSPDTWRYQSQAGFAFDSTLGFADHIGFRCGTCRPFPVFDLMLQKELPLLEVPLIFMEHTALDPAYMGLSAEDFLRRFSSLVDTVKKLRGTMTLLWHNHLLTEPWQKELFLECLDYGK